MRSYQAHVCHDLSDRRRVLITSDIHGEYQKLEASLKAQNWDPELDALIIAGDLADRGRDSEVALEWLTRKNVYRVLGNHEIMPRMLLDRRRSRETLIKWGGAWFVDLPRERLTSIAEAFEAAPVTMTVLTPGGNRIGVVHADCMTSWDRHVSLLSDPYSMGYQLCLDMSLWSRETILNIMESERRLKCRSSEVNCYVSGIDHVFHGHTPCDTPFSHDNRTWIDTGAYEPDGS